ncbi:MAG TPA: alpha/beta hydrolase [Chthoniobacterales bacterium]|nr:alpha/beta hydrolase [Chthoniobacterales bacterium]
MITMSIFWALVFALFVTKTEQPNEYQKKSRRRFRARLTKTSGSLLALVLLSSCASPRSTSSNRLDEQIPRADAACRTLDASHVMMYNNAVAAIAREIDGKTPAELRTELDPAQVKVDEPAVELPLVRYHAVQTPPQPKQSPAIGAPVLLEYDTSRAPIYPREGMFLPATAIYQRVQDQPHLSFIAADNRVTLGRKSYPLVTDKTAAASMLARRARRVAQSGLTNLLHPEMRAKGQIVLTQPYDPNKIPILLVHGLQTTPFTFLQLVNALESDPEIARRFQFWHCYYSTGTPVLLNALRLREELERTVQVVDPEDADFATHHIVVLGHSMGGLIAHTLVSSSGDRLWRSLFVVPPDQLRGNPETAQRLQRAFFFRRNPRVVRAIFVATPHRGSAMADSWIGGLGKALIRLPHKLQTDLTDIAEKNVEVRTAEAATFFKELNFTSVHMLSPHDPILLALARLPIAVPFHSIMGEKHSGAGSDGVVRYASSHLDGANSELIVRSGHNAFNNPEARNEVIRVLREELHRSPAPKRAPATMLAGYAE